MPFFNLVQICTGFSRSVRYRVYPVNHTLKMTRGPIIMTHRKIMAPAASYLVVYHLSCIFSISHDEELQSMNTYRGFQKR